MASNMARVATSDMEEHDDSDGEVGDRDVEALLAELEIKRDADRNLVNDAPFPLESHGWKVAC